MKIDPNGNTWCEIQGENIFYIADELLGIIDREKKEQAKEIFAKIYNEIKYCSVGQIVIRQLAKEYGVEL